MDLESGIWEPGQKRKYPNLETRFTQKSQGLKLNPYTPQALNISLHLKTFPSRGLNRKTLNSQ